MAGSGTGPQTTNGSVLGANNAAEIYSDSLNVTTSKSEEKKYYNSSSANGGGGPTAGGEGEELHRSSPSFYINEDVTSEDESNREGYTSADVAAERQSKGKDDAEHKSYVPASSFASGAQAQIEYTDK